MSITECCAYLGYSRAAYYEWMGSNLKDSLNDELVLGLIREHRIIHTKMGTRKLLGLIRENLNSLGIKMGRDKLFDLLRNVGLLVKRKKKYVVTTQSFRRFSQFEDHFNGKIWIGPHQAWVSDITYLRVGSSFRYLYLITDAFSRKIIGWFLGQTLETKWALEALGMAIRQCPDTTAIVHHSDRGFQYCSNSYTDLLKLAGMTSSMGEAGNCYDNAMAERVNGILKIEYLLDATFKNEKEAGAAVKQAIWAYNERRPHLSLDMRIPSEVHQGTVAFSSLKYKDRPRQKPVKAK